jgi:hypothetical protein
MSGCSNPALTALIGALYDAMACRTSVGRLVLTRVRIGTVVIEGEIRMIQVPVDKVADCGPIAILDAFGNHARVDGVPVWALSDDTGLELVAAPDGMTAQLRSTDGAVRTVQVQVTADADLGEGVKTLTGLADIEYVGGEAVMISIPVAIQP